MKQLRNMDWRRKFMGYIFFLSFKTSISQLSNVLIAIGLAAEAFLHDKHKCDQVPFQCPPGRQPTLIYRNEISIISIIHDFFMLRKFDRSIPAPIVNVKNPSVLAWCGWEGWLSNPSLYTSLQLDCGDKKAAGEGMDCVVYRRIGEGGAQGWERLVVDGLSGLGRS
ncbi:hypothetical protein AVEN_13617-1 [Araneus ventricosus]|uniref:Uncharacterized protein n=1 Tax=Araneus ventricosus TaxID=182803 RepID=A0A4Y2FLK6_ARAVE|nr:hypothetical protein AVEN_13617-1 [Araneus ventricosus]